MRALIPVFLVLFSFVAAADVPVSSDVIRSEAGVQQRSVSASNGNSFYTVWEQWKGGDVDIVGSRVTADGQPIDLGGIPMQPTWRTDSNPTIVFNGSTYVVVFTSEFYGVKLVEVNRDSEVLTELNPVPRYIGRTSIAWNGTVYLLAWEEDYTVRGVILDRGFQPLSPEFAIGVTNYGGLAVASNGTNFLVTWSSSGNGAIVTADGNVSPLATGLPSGEKAIASDGVSYVVVRLSEAIAIDGSGTITKRVSIPIAAAPAIVWDGTHYLVAWSANERIFGAELDAGLNVTRDPVRLIAAETTQRFPSLADNGSRTMLTWSDGHIRSTMFDRGEFARVEPSSISTISTGFADQTPLDAIWTGDILNVLWYEEAAVRFGRVRISGELLSGEGRAFSSATAAVIAWNGSIFGVALQRGQNVEVQRLTSTGEPLGPPVSLGSGNMPRIASNGRDFAVAWNATNLGLVTSIFTEGGDVSTPRKIPFVVAPFLSAVGIVATNDAYVLLSSESSGGKVFTYAYVATPIAADGSHGSQTVLTRGTGIYAAPPARIASNGRVVLYAWYDTATHARIGDGAEFIAANGTEGFLEAVGLEGSTPVFVLRNSAGRFLHRGPSAIELPLAQSFAFASSAVGSAFMYARETPGVAGLRALGVTRAYIRFVTAPKRRAVRSAG